MDSHRLLTATRSARKSLDLDAPVDLDEITECLRIGMQAANGSNQQSWRWLVIVDPELRAKASDTIRDALTKLEQEIAQGHGKASAGAASGTSTERCRWKPEAVGTWPRITAGSSGSST